MSSDDELSLRDSPKVALLVSAGFGAVSDGYDAAGSETFSRVCDLSFSAGSAWDVQPTPTVPAKVQRAVEMCTELDAGGAVEAALKDTYDDFCRIVSETRTAYDKNAPAAFADQLREISEQCHALPMLMVPAETFATVPAALLPLAKNMFRRVRLRIYVTVRVRGKADASVVVVNVSPEPVERFPEQFYNTDAVRSHVAKIRHDAAANTVWFAGAPGYCSPDAWRTRLHEFATPNPALIVRTEEYKFLLVLRGAKYEPMMQIVSQFVVGPLFRNSSTICADLFRTERNEPPSALYAAMSETLARMAKEKIVSTFADSFAPLAW